MDIRESISIVDSIQAPNKSNIVALKNFSSNEFIDKIVQRSKGSVELNDNPAPGQLTVNRRCGSGLPTTPNLVCVQTNYHGKDEQYRLLKGKVPVIPTYRDPGSIDGEFIAKRIHGQKQQGQMFNQIPNNYREYVFQPKIEILKEYRVVVFYMNNEFHVSGIYQKTGSNLSFISITSGQIYDTSVEIATTACRVLGYGFSGVDIAQTSAQFQENIVGSTASKFGKLMGKMQSSKPVGNFVFFEANTLPSLANPMIANDLLKKMIEKKV